MTTKRKFAQTLTSPTRQPVDDLGREESSFSDDSFSDSSGGDDGSYQLTRAVGLLPKTTKAARKHLQVATDQTSNQIQDFSELTLKPDHFRRPMWVDATKKKVIIECFSPLFSIASDFLTTIAEPISRTSHFHEYKITVHSLYAAVSAGLSATDIIFTLTTFLKTPLPDEVKAFILKSTKAYGKVKLVLKHNRYFLETPDADVLRILLKDTTISASVADLSSIVTEAAPVKGHMVIPGTKEAAGVKQQYVEGDPNQSGNTHGPQGIDDIQMMLELREEDDDEDENQRQVHTVEILKDGVQTVQRQCLQLGYPLLEEYDFRNDEVNPNLDIDLKPGTKIRDYQEKSLAKMFGNGRARSGIIVLPCGAGKTLVGITAACTVRKGIIVLCTSSMSVVQWRNEFLKWSNINPGDIAVFTSDHKEKFSRNTGIIVSTYSMVTQTRARAHEAQKMMDFLQGREWGLMILDEVHVVPASIFRKVTEAIATHSKLGLTATLLREDDKITDLNFLIGPKLYEANWTELAEQGHIAKVQCAEVWCPMTTEFHQEYLREKNKKRALLYIMNPRKFQACQYLIDFHERRGDKIIVFSDNVYALRHYALKLNKAYIYGGTPQNERLTILENFQHNEKVNTVFLSKIGDTSLDLPEATCLIQISSHYGSRRQEAQRLGRILRAKRRNDEGFNAFFYSLVSKDTTEMYYSAKRQAFLVDQGYTFKVITQLAGMERFPGLAYSTAAERRELLQEVMLQNETSADVENIDDDLFSAQSGRIKLGSSGPRRMAGMLSDLSGGQDMAYVEYNKGLNKDLKGKHRSLFKKLGSEQQKRRQAARNLM